EPLADLLRAAAMVVGDRAAAIGARHLGDWCLPLHLRARDPLGLRLAPLCERARRALAFVMRLRWILPSLYLIGRAIDPFARPERLRGPAPCRSAPPAAQESRAYNAGRGSRGD